MDNVLVVAPTGAGKTVIGCEIVRRRAAKTLWIAHRRELITQAAERLRPILGREEVGLIAPGYDLDPYASVQVGTVQTLLARKRRPEADLLVLDEAHHYVADDWVKLTKAYPGTKIVGLTATPERQDGRPLGDLFESIVVAAQYSELLRDGHLVPCRVYQPPDQLGRDLAQDPVEAWKRHAEGSRTFAFVGTVKAAYELASRFNNEGIRAAVVEGKTNKRDRDQTLKKLASGEITVIVNVYALTEGVDVPAARTVLLARGCDHVGPYLQMAGRVLRPHESKADAILIDLTGATLKHGLPTEDRVYSLDGEGIKRAAVAPLRNCMFCGATLPAAQRICPDCGHEYVPPEVKPPRIYSLELREVYAGASTPDEAKEREYKRLRALGREKGWKLYFVQKAYKELFGEKPIIYDATEEERYAEFDRLRDLARTKGYKPGFVKLRYKDMFGTWPDRGWRI